MQIFITRTAVTTLSIAILLLVGCGQNSNITTTLGPTETAIAGDPVYFQNNVIGEINSVSAESAGTQLHINLNKDAISLLSSDAVAVENTLKPNTPVEIYNGVAEPGTLTPGSKIEGVNNMVQFGTWALGNVVGIGGVSLGDYLKQFDGYINSGDYADQQEQLIGAIQQGSELAKQTVTQIAEEIDKNINQLQEMEDQLVVAGEQIGTDVGAVVQELEKSGAEIYAELEKLGQKLESQTNPESQSDDSTMNILLAFLKGLNISLEENAAETEVAGETEEKDN